MIVNAQIAKCADRQILAAGNAGKLFFAQIEYKRSAELFHRLGVNSLPYIFRLSSSFPVEADGTIKLRTDEVMKHADYAAYPWTAEDMSSFVREKVCQTFAVL